MNQITSLQEFVQVFGLSISMSLVGGLIGHFVKNGIIELPRFVIEYTEEEAGFSSNKVLMFCQRAYAFVLFAVGYRTEDNAKKRIFFDLGFLGDLLIAIGTGIVSKTALALANTDNDFAVISSSLLAGYAGLAYLKTKQNKEIAETVIEEINDSSKV